MRGRTNVGGGGEFLVDGNVISGIVDESGGIVTGDFVQKKMTSKSIVPSILPGYSSSGGKILSDVFTLTDGTFCVFFSKSYYNIKNSLYAWKYKIENNEIIDVGCLKIPTEDFNLGGGHTEIEFVEISDNEFMFSEVSSKKTEENGSTTLLEILTFFSITILGNTASMREMGSLEINVEDTNTYISTRGISNICKLNSGYFALKNSYYTRISSIKTTYYCDLILIHISDGNVFLDDVIKFSNESSSSAIDIPTVVPYDDKNYFFAIQNQHVILYKYGSNGMTEIRKVTFDFSSEWQTSGWEYNSYLYLGENKTLYLQRVASQIAYAKIFTYSENENAISGEIEIGSVPYDGNEIFYRILFAKKNNECFAIISNSNRDKYVGVFSISKMCFSESEEFYKEGSLSSTSVMSFDGINFINNGLSAVTYDTGSSSYPLVAYGMKKSGDSISSLEEEVQFLKYLYKIDGVAKQSGANGDTIEVYVPK